MMEVGTAIVGAALVTRGDVSMKPILAALPFDEIVVWDNSSEVDLGVYGRYAAIAQLKKPIVLTLDDDTVLPPESLDALLRSYEHGKVVCNVPERFRHRYTDSGLVGFGAIFDKDLVQRAFDLFEAAAPEADAAWFRRTCDIVFTMLNDLVFVDLPYEELAYAHDDTRMWKQGNHFEEREEMRELCRRILAKR